MIVEERGGRYFAVHPIGADDIGKARRPQAETVVPEDMVETLRLKYVADYDLRYDSIKYSEDFYADLYKEIEAGKSDIEAYEALGFDVVVLGRHRATNACKKAREKARLAKAREQEGGDEASVLESYRGNKYVRMVEGNKLYYKEEFYEDLSKLLEDGASPLEAYRSLGFNPDVLGAQRAYKAADHAKEWKRRQLAPVYKVGDFSGTVPLAKMMDEAGYPDNTSEWTAKLMGRVIYLETILEELKKKR